jgi:hypothetical protein
MRGGGLIYSSGSTAAFAHHFSVYRLVSLNHSIGGVATTEKFASLLSEVIANLGIAQGVTQGVCERFR